MKKILCALLAVVMLLGLSACKKEKGGATNTVGDSVDENTVSLVNVAFSSTKEIVENAKSLGFEVNYRRNLTYDNDKSDAMRISLMYNYAGADDSKQFVYKHSVKSSTSNDDTMLYTDSKNIYGFKASETYLITNNNLAKEYLADFDENVTIYDASDLKATSTVVMDTNSGGHVFVIEYECDGFDAADVFGPLYAEGSLELEIKPISLSISGTIDTEGRLLNETIKYVYKYEYLDNSEEDPDNSEPSGVKKTAKVELVAELEYDYDFSVVKAPSEMTIPSSNDGTEDKIKELSITDFLKLGQQN